MDGGIIASFKAQYKRRFVRLALDRDNQGIENMYKIDQLQAMHMARAAWAAVTPQTIMNCWKHVGLVPNYNIPHPLPVPNMFVPTYPTHQHYMHPLVPVPPVPAPAIALPHMPAPVPPIVPNTFIPAYPAYQDYAHPPPRPVWHEARPQLPYIHPEVQQALDQLDQFFATEGTWTDQEIVEQIIRERQEGFSGEEEEEYDLDDYYYHQNPHIYQNPHI